MNDVIFQGGEGVKSLNLAEVSLNFSNLDKSLDIAYDHVNILRRIYRDGENEYRINGKKVRLKDIRELFLDTGVGKEGYSIISQGRIDEIISSSPRDRRAIFEEASGISKHKYRRDESSKKLAKVSEDLDLIQKDLDYKRKDLDLLKAYRDNYLNHKDITKRLDRSAYFYMKDRSRTLLEKIDDLEENIKSIDTKIKNLSKEKNLLSDKLEPFKGEYLKVIEARKSCENLYRENEKAIEKSTSLLEINKQKLSYNSKDLERIRDNIKANRRKRVDFEKDLKENEKAYQKLNETYGLLKDSLNSYRDKEESLKLGLGELKKDQKTYEKEIKILSKEIYDIEIDQKSKEIFDKKRSEQAKIKALKIQDINKDLSSLNNDKDKLSRDLDKVTGEISTLKTKMKTLDLSLDEKKLAFDKISKDISDNKFSLKTSISEYKLLKENIDKNRGYFYSIQDFLNKSKDYGLDDLYLGTLASLIRVRDGYEDVIEILLGSSLQNIVTRSKEDTRKLINFVNSKKLGRITFLPLDSIKSFSKAKPNQEEVIAMAYDLISYDKTLKPIIDHFLGSSVVVENIDKAVSLSEKIKGYKIVSKDLDIINTWGSMVAGNDKNRKKNSSLLNRDKKLDLLKSQILNLKKREDDLAKKSNGLKQTIMILEEEQKTNKIRLDDTLNNKSKLITRLEGLKIRIFEKKDQVANLSQEVDFENEEVKTYDLESKREEKDRLEEKLSKVNEDILKDDKDLSNLNNLKIKKENKLEMVQRDLSINKNTRLKLTNSLSDLDNSSRLEDKLKIDLEKSLDDLGKKEIKFRKDIKNAQVENSKLEIKLEKFENDLKRMNDENSILIEKDKSLEKTINELNIKKVRLTYKMDSSKEKYESLLDKIKPYISVSFDKLEEEFGKNQSFRVNNQDLVDLLKKKNAIGYFTDDSLAQYDQAKKDFDFLSNQVNDLINSKKDIEKMISQLEGQMRKEFIKNFKIISDKFTKIFKILFKGGDARLILDSKDTLDAGVEIEARPPGKSPKSISLLSGGEKALTAVSLLFAIFEINPAPFAILDEIDAALDEANIKRYIDYLKLLSDKSQFIMITHRQTTMHLAEVIHGVTIGDDGISKLYSLDFGKN